MDPDAMKSLLDEELEIYSKGENRAADEERASEVPRGAAAVAAMVVAVVVAMFL